MPQLQREGAAAGPRITGFRGRALLVDDVVHSGAVVVTPTAVIAWDGGDLGPAANLDPPPEFILLGTGAALVRPEPALVAAYEARGIGIEAMDTRAAARAWGVLRAEGRWISAALRPL